ncbi:hypothetical protein [Pedobacter gandavensis]|uniref:hypothetical protein n=1 Tax=Pedobacter gandavensis TaxID=2679963 RepID=UPI00292D760E|nr:hypothetical protein [Pedobacter gandavensis]
MQQYLRFEKLTVNPEKAIKLLKDHGTVITIEQAKAVLDFLYKLSNLSVSQAINRVIQHQNEGLIKERYGETKKQIL